MRISAFIFIIISMYQLAKAAQPEQIDTIIDQISYTLYIENKSAKVISGKECKGEITIPRIIEYRDIQFKVEEINNCAFKDNRYLTKISIPSSVNYIGYQAFFNCRYMKEIDLCSSCIPTIEYAVFSFCERLKSIKLPNTIKDIGASAFSHCQELTSIYIPQSIENIYSAAFDDCRKLKEVYFVDIADWCKVKLEGYGTSPFIGGNADLYVDSVLVTDLIIPNGASRISTFEGCGSIQSITIPQSIGYIYGFSHCPNLAKITLEGNSTINYNAFQYLPNLIEVNCLTSIPPELESIIYAGGIEVNAFYNSYPEYMTLHVPVGTKEVYENTYGWKDFGTIIDDLPNNSGLDEVSIDNTKPIDVYNMNGVCIFSGIYQQDLPSGIYIIKQGTRSKTIIK
ncbi:MAG: leucine-rich repeat domain-containing protein [Muribaculaceae bacterium]|nr:leucine-rich repeat domain-containing protein [Muribaculaceae bacterium]